MAEEKKEPAVLSGEIDKKYKMKKGFAPGMYHFKGYEIDLTACTIEEADKMFEMKIGVIDLIKAPEPPAKVEVKK